VKKAKTIITRMGNGLAIARGPWQLVATVAASDASKALGGEPPAEICIFPNPIWKLADMDLVTDDQSQRLVVADFRRRQIETLIDYEHESVQEGVRALAAGWISTLRADSTGLYGGGIRWTDKAAGHIRAGEYRYFSPTALFDEDTKRVVALLSVALTNTPRTNEQSPLTAKTTRIAASIVKFHGREEGTMKKYFQLLKAFLDQKGSMTRKAAVEALNEISAEIENEEGDETAPLITAKKEQRKTIAASIGFDEEVDHDGSEAEKTLGEVCELLDLPADAPKKKVKASILALQHPTDKVDRAEYEKVVAERDTAKAGDDKAKIETLITANRKKISPALEKKIRAIAAKDLREAQELVAELPDAKPTSLVTADVDSGDEDEGAGGVCEVGDGHLRMIEPESATIAATCKAIMKEKGVDYAKANEIRKEREAAANL
jgi:phage I-like protein